MLALFGEFMDIFTTQLTRVVQTPIKKAKLKVKALIKDAGAHNLKEDHDHLENHDYYFEHSVKKTYDEIHEEPTAETDNEQSSSLDYYTPDEKQKSKKLKILKKNYLKKTLE